MRRLEPPGEQAPAGLCRADIAAVSEFLDLLAQRRHQGRHQLIHTGFAQGLVGREPADLRVQDCMRGIGKVRMQGHTVTPITVCWP